MIADDFRKLALSLDGAEERSHMQHPDFRVNGKIFATLGYPDEGWAMVKLTPEQQEMFMKLAPTTFAPVKGSWGTKGATNVNLKKARKTIVKEALVVAHRNLGKGSSKREARSPKRR